MSRRAGNAPIRLASSMVLVPSATTCQASGAPGWALLFGLIGGNAGANAPREFIVARYPASERPGRPVDVEVEAGRLALSAFAGGYR